MRGRKQLLITFDYELFLGERSGSVKECLIGPTDQLLECLDGKHFKAIFFIDTIYLLRLKEIAISHDPAKTDLEQITGQLIRLVKSGHEIQPHIHPHWLDAVYNPGKNEWSLANKRYYSFASLTEKQRSDLFDRSVTLIRSLLDDADSSQPVDAYRAGGWSIQPFEHFRPMFIQYGIKHEWSVIPGKYHFSDAHGFDFRKAPVGRPCYHFDQDPCTEEGNGPFTEWTISTLTMSPVEKWFDFKISGLLKRLGKTPSYKGSGVASVIEEEGDIYSKGNQKRITASFEGLNPFTLQKYLSAIHHSEYYQFISHPKLITPYEFRVIKKLFSTLDKKYEIHSDFRKWPVE